MEDLRVEGSNKMEVKFFKNYDKGEEVCNDVIALQYGSRCDR